MAFGFFWIAGGIRTKENMWFDLSIIKCRCGHLSFFFRESERSQFGCKVFEVYRCRFRFPLLEWVLHDYHGLTATQTRIYFIALKTSRSKQRIQLQPELSPTSGLGCEDSTRGHCSCGADFKPQIYVFCFGASGRPVACFTSMWSSFLTHRLGLFFFFFFFTLLGIPAVFLNMSDSITLK